MNTRLAIVHGSRLRYCQGRCPGCGNYNWLRGRTPMALTRGQWPAPDVVIGRYRGWSRQTLEKAEKLEPARDSR